MTVWLALGPLKSKFRFWQADSTIGRRKHRLPIMCTVNNLCIIFPLTVGREFRKECTISDKQENGVRVQSLKKSGEMDCGAFRVVGAAAILAAGSRHLAAGPAFEVPRSRNFARQLRRAGC